MNCVRSSFVLFLWFLIFFASQCTIQKVNETSNDRLYKKENNELNAQYLIYHINDTVSQLFYDLSNEALIYKRTDTSNYFFSHVKLVLKISLEDNLDVANDTSSIVIRDRQQEVKTKQLIGSLFFRLKSGTKYHIEVSIYDINKKTRYSKHLLADKTNKDNRQNFLITNPRNELFFNTYYKPQEVVYLRSERNKEKLFTVDYFEPTFKLAPPPFSTDKRAHFSYKPDSTFSVYSKNDLIELSLFQNGFLHLITNTETKEGVTFLIYEASFPKIKNAEEMIKATRYIMAKKEFDNCMEASDKKAAIDAFWYEIAGSHERAKELIRKYYGRIQEANKTFTSFQEGWKTDRGMIYTVFGAPTRVTKQKNGERWTYGETGNPNSIVFSFIKIINPFTDNDYYLERDEVYKLPWYQAVDAWRQGRIYLDN